MTIGRGTLPLTKGEITLRLVAHELYKLDRYLVAGGGDDNVKAAVKDILKLARKAILKEVK